MAEINLTISNRFADFVTDWDYEQYLLFGGYGSGKSYHVAVKIILKLLEEKRTCLVVRQVRETIKESCFSLFKEILEKMDILSDVQETRLRQPRYKEMAGGVVATVSPMEIRFPNGSRIIFRGMDNIQKIKSINGVSMVWIEEASEIKYEAYTELLGRIREPNKTLHYFITTNPAGRESWIYRTFFQYTDENGKDVVIQSENEVYRRRTLVNPKNGVYYHHSVCDDNPYLPRGYIRRLDGLKENDKQLWIVARYGRFGASGTRVLPQFIVAKDARKFVNKVNSVPSRFHFFGLDFGFETSYNALISCCVDDATKVLYIYDEVYRNHLTDDRFIQLDGVQRAKERSENCDKPICADSAEPKTIQYYRQQGFQMYGCKKYIGSRLQNTKKMKRFKKIVCSPKCKNTIRELKELTYAKDNQGNMILDEFNIDPHTMSALWYALNNYTVADVKEIKTNSKAG